MFAPLNEGSNFWGLELNWKIPIRLALFLTIKIQNYLQTVECLVQQNLIILL